MPCVAVLHCVAKVSILVFVVQKDNVCRVLSDDKMFCKGLNEFLVRYCKSHVPSSEAKRKTVLCFRTVVFCLGQV